VITLLETKYSGACSRYVGVHMYEIRLTTNYDYWGLCVHVHVLVHKL
jgi:hypothetical protein